MRKRPKKCFARPRKPFRADPCFKGVNHEKGE
jgi:hypothetical protein